MAELTTFTCDVCGKPKGDTNHWWRAWLFHGLLVVGPWSQHVPPSPSNRGAFAEQELHFCGEACATKKLSEFMGKQAAPAAGGSTSPTAALEPYTGI